MFAVAVLFQLVPKNDVSYNEKKWKKGKKDQANKYNRDKKRKEKLPLALVIPPMPPFVVP
jgi:hypothetical protein